uniref:Prostaglandin E synthase 2 n=1 Tax=Dracunculus medinensis TaxID=318479 RepID=A0A0N4UNS3_DRAME
LNLRLYQYQTCPFCCKVRAFLDYFGFSYEVVEVNPITRSQLKFLTDYKKVPVVIIDNDRVLIESSLIISILSTFLRNSHQSISDVIALFPELVTIDPKTEQLSKSFPNKYFIMLEPTKLSDAEIQNAKEERDWREWVDNYFIHLISPNVYRTLTESLETFYWFDEVGEWKRVFPAWERYLTIYIGSIIMYFISKRLKKRLEIACNEWVQALGNRLFLGGQRPNLADLALYGSINSFVGCKAFREICKQSGIEVWYDRMSAEVESKAGSSLLAKRCSK